MADTNQTIQQQLNNATAGTFEAVLGLIGFGDWIAGQLRPLTDADARTVTANVLVMDVPGEVIAVVATAGGSGIYLIGPEGATTATKQCTIAYDVNNFATITFHAADGVTAAKVTYKPVPYPSNKDGTRGLGNLLAMVPT